MNDNDIKKALEEELHSTQKRYHFFMETCDTENPDTDRFISLLIDTLALINRLQSKNKELDEKNVLYKGLIDRQNAEIERYKGVIKLLENDVLTAKTEAVKEFAERLKSLQIGLEISGESLYYIPIDCIDNLVKEMTESVNYGSSKMTEGNQ